MSLRKTPFNLWPWLVVLSIIALVDAFGLWVLVHSGLEGRYVANRSEDLIPVQMMRVNPEGEVAHKLRESGISQWEGKEKVIRVLQFIMNSVSKVGQMPTNDPEKLFHLVTSDQSGALCGGMSNLFQYALSLENISSRRVQLYRNFMDRFDTHVTVEVHLEGRWVIFDPTFNVSFEKEGQLLGAFDLQRSSLNGTIANVKPVFYGEVKYPARLEQYYMNWMPLYNNVFIVPPPNDQYFLKKMPPFRYFYFASYTLSGQAGRSLIWMNRLNILFVVILPSVLMAGTAMLGVVYLVNRRIKKSGP